jgi:nitroreductase
MDFLELAAKRYSVRKFTDEKVKEEDLAKILKAGLLAPTAHNEQPQRILVINSDEALEKLKKCTSCHFNSRTALLICSDKSACWTRKYDGKQSYDIDAAIVTTHMMLEAENIGVGTTWVMHFRPQVVREEFALPESYEPTALLIMGYPAPDAEPSPMHSEFKDEKEIVFWNEY